MRTDAKLVRGFCGAGVGGTAGSSSPSFSFCMANLLFGEVFCTDGILADTVLTITAVKVDGTVIDTYTIEK